MEIIRISEGDGVVVYERIRRGDLCPKYVVVNDKTGNVIGEARKRKGAEKLARAMRKAGKALMSAREVEVESAMNKLNHYFALMVGR